MKNIFTRVSKLSFQVIRMTIVLTAWVAFGQNANSQILTTTAASRCGEGTLVLRATATSGTITWYDVPFYGTALATGETYTTPSLSVTKTYYADAVDGSNCSLNPNKARIPVIATVSASAMQASIYYSSTTFCKTVSGWQPLTLTGTTGGTFTIDPSSGLSFNNTLGSDDRGSIQPSTSTVGTYTVTYAAPATEGCTESPAVTTVTIATAPVTPGFNYAGGTVIGENSYKTYCSSNAPVEVSWTTEVAGGTFSSSPSGLNLAANGTFTPGTSSTGVYTVTYTVPGGGGCSPQTASVTLAILRLPAAIISYGSLTYTKNQGTQAVSLSGTGAYTGGTFTASAGGLTIDASGGTITPGSSTAGDYTVTYTLAAVSPCAAATPATTTVTIYPLPTASISGTQSVCQNSSAPDITFTGANGTAPYTFSYRIGEGDPQSVVTISGSSVTVAQPTIVTGTYLYTLLSVSDAHSSSQAQTGTATITVSTAPLAAFTYPYSPYCTGGTEDPLPTMLEGSVKGNFTVPEADVAKLIFLNASTGLIDLSASTAGTYTVTNTISGSGGCSTVTSTASVTITKLPVATFSYAGTPYCQDVSDPSPTYSGGGIAGLFSASPVGLTFVNVNTGQVDLSSSATGTYTITNTIAASSGCAEVTATSSIEINSAVVVSIPVFLAGATSNRCGAAETVPYDATAVNSTSIIYTLDATTAGFSGNSINASSGAVTYAANWSGTTTVTATATAYCGNTTTATHMVTTSPAVMVEDPVFTLGGTSTRCQAAGTVTYAATATNSTSIYYSMDETSRTAGNSINPSTGEATYVSGWFGTTTITTTGTADCSNTATANHVVTINPLPTASAGGTQTICSNRTATVSGAAAAHGTISWAEDGAGTITSGGTTLTPVYTAHLDDVGNTVTLTMTVTTSYASCSSATATATYTVLVDPLPTATAGGSQIICANTTATVSGASSSNGTILWTEDGAGSITAGETTLTPTYAAASGDAGNTVTLTMTVTSSNTCTPQIAVATYTVYINPVISGNTSGSAVSICNNTSTTLTGGTLAGGSGTYAYLWESSTAAAGTFTAAEGTNNAANYTTATLTTASTNVYFRRTVTSGGCTDVAEAVKVTVNPVIAGNGSGSSVTICNSTSTTLTGGTLSGGSGTYTYLWKSSDAEHGTYSAASGTNNEANYTTATLTTASTLVWFSRTVTSGGCTDVAEELKVTVNPDAAIALTSAVGSNAQTLVLNTSLTNITYSVTGGGTGAGVTGLPAGVAGAYNAGVFTISGTPSAAGNYSYTVTTTGTCAQTTSEGTIHVDVAPGDLTADQTICAGTVPASLELVGSVGDIVRWEKSVNSEFTVPITIAITATTLTGANMGALTTDTWFRAVVQSGTCPVAYSTIIKVAVNPLPGPTFTDQPGAISPASTDVTYATESGKSSYVWTCSGSSPTDYTITSGGGNTNSVTLKWISTGDHTVTVNYSNSTGCQAVGAAIAITNVGGTAPAVGDSYGGGKVAYILQPGEPGYVAGETHGLIAALADIYFDETSTFPWWNGTATTTGATATALGTGKANTTTIIGSPGNTGTYAAKLCRDYWIGDYYDWYLPSIDELIKIYPNWAAIGGMVGSYYWSSSEHDASQAKSQYSDGTSLNQSKSVNCYVRAIRTF